MCAVSLYLYGASLSEGPEDLHCLPYLADPAGTFILITITPRLRTGSRINKFLYTIKNPTRERRTKTICDHEPLMPVSRIIRARQRPTDNLEITCTLQYTPTYLKPTNNPIIKTIYPSPILNATESQVIPLAIQSASQNRGTTSMRY